MDRKGFDRIEQLFEYFLVDPGMEPVVQTSRIQLAIASVQLFVQRCLLNLEPGVHPRAIVNARHWSWMKRYRVWEANRKLFLYPENWLEPEFRDDKSNLFAELEGTLLQGDVSNELAENAFFTYLKGLEKLARLDVVSCYVEEKSDPIDNVLHLIGRTHSLPHEYFYRTYAHQVWMPWEPIEAEIESDHVAAVVWRDRLHVFWVTFMEQAQNAPPGGKSIKSFADESAAYAPGKQVEVQLHWTERFQGAWSTREAGAEGRTLSLSAGAQFYPEDALIHVSKEYAEGEERALLIHLGGQLDQSFRLVSKNSRPTPQAGIPNPTNPYGLKAVEETRYVGFAQLGVNFTQKLTIEGGTTKTESDHEKILDLPGDFRLLRPSKPLELPNAEVDAAHVASLVSPFFLSDSRYTFYVEPKLLQQTFAVTEKWGYEVEPYQPGIVGEIEIGELPVIPEIPEILIEVEPEPPWEIPDPRIKFEVQPGQDWLTGYGTLLDFGGTLVGPEGGLDDAELTSPVGDGVSVAISSDHAGGDIVELAVVVGDAGVDTPVAESMLKTALAGGGADSAFGGVFGGGHFQPGMDGGGFG